MSNPDVGHMISSFMKRNSPSLLTGLGVGGTVGVGYLSSRAGQASALLISEVEREYGRKLTFKERMKLTWDLYIPPVVVGGVTIAAIISANRINSMRTAAITAAYSLSEKALYEYRDKIEEIVGKDKAQAFHDAYAQEKVDNQPPPSVLTIGENSVLCCELFTGRYFESDMETIKKACNTVNALMLSEGRASLSDFYSEIELPLTSASDIIGWDTDRMMELIFSTAITDRGKPCLTFDYNYTKEL